MATHDYVIDNQSAVSFRADLNDALAAIVTNNSSGAAPVTTYANMIWCDTTANQLKKRNEANTAWIILGTIDETTGVFTPSGGPPSQTQTVWNTGTAATESLISPAKLQAKLVNHRDTTALGWGQTWQSVSRSVGTSYLNNTGAPIQVSWRGADVGIFQVSANNSTWLSLVDSNLTAGTFVVPAGYYYRQLGGSIGVWRELR